MYGKVSIPFSLSRYRWNYRLKNILYFTSVTCFFWLTLKVLFRRIFENGDNRVNFKSSFLFLEGVKILQKFAKNPAALNLFCWHGVINYQCEEEWSFGPVKSKLYTYNSHRYPEVGIETCKEVECSTSI